MPAEEWERVVDVNLIGVWHTVRAALPQIVRARRPDRLRRLRLQPSPTASLASPYAVSKAGVEALGRALRAELAPLGASASVVYFGWVDTELVQDSLDRQDDGAAPDPARDPARPSC